MNLISYMKNRISNGFHVYNGLPTRNPMLSAKDYYIDYMQKLSIWFLLIYWVFFGGKFYGIF